MHNHISNIFVFSFQHFTYFVGDEMRFFKSNIGLHKYMHIYPDITHSAACPDFMASHNSFNPKNKIADLFFFKP